MVVQAIEKEPNPLGCDPKREKSGSDTFRKYNYQYHWAFCRMLDEHENGREFAIFVEEHEDVTIADSLSPQKAAFEFNQIKETSQKHTIHSLTKSKKNQQSLLEKLASSSCNKFFTDKISTVNFVSTGGYSFGLHKEGYSFEVIKSGELTADELNKIEECVSKIKGSEGLVSKLAFVVPELPSKGFDLVVEGKISSLISKLAPGMKYDANSIYGCVIRDLNRKGENCYDYKDWPTALKKKAITSKELDAVINLYVSRKPDQNLTTEVVEILKNEYNLKSVARRKIINGFNRYYTKRLSSRDNVIKQVSSSIIHQIAQLSSIHSEAKGLEDDVKKRLTKDILNYFPSPEAFTGAFLYELLEGVDI